MADKVKAQELKDAGNAALQKDQPKEAIQKYTEAIALDPTNHVLFSNRSAAHAKLQDYTEALKDAESTVEIKPDWGKGYSRMGAALVYLNQLDKAEEAYERGLVVDPNNEQLKNGLQECKAKVAASRPGNKTFMGGPPSGFNIGFDDPNLTAKLAMDPRTRSYLSDPTYLKMIDDLRKNPQKMNEYLKDPRFMTTMSVILNLDMKGSPPGNDSDDDDKPPSPPTARKTNKSKVEKMDVDLSSEQQQALAEKEKGNAAYKKKDFPTAIEHYKKAIETESSNMTFRTNLAAVYFEMKDYETCVKTCEEAIEVGRENRADFKLIAKAFTRIGNAYKQLKDFPKARTYYQKAMSEHRTPETKDLLSKVEKSIKEHERLAYVDVEKAEVEKEKGNQMFKKGDFPAAIHHYSEAVKRNPNDAKIYSNRAACYTKLAEFNMGLKDCDECIRLEPDFIKGYIRKAKIQQGLKQFSQAQDSYQKALDVDSNHPEAIAGIKECVMAASSDPEEVRKRAMSDPEVQQILKDPAMRLILEQMQSDPRALNDHLKNPEISAKIQKLMQSGLISIR